jgi:hypothetical protein
MQDNEGFNMGADLVAYIKSRPLISVNALEKQAEMPKNVLTQAVRGTRNVPEHYWHKLNSILIDYGYSIDTNGLDLGMREYYEDLQRKQERQKENEV